MISESESTTKICNICYDNFANYHCKRCSFVLCKTCDSIMSDYNNLNRCCQCNLEDNWKEAYNIKIRQYENFNVEININENNRITTNKNILYNILFVVILIVLCYILGFFIILISDEELEDSQNNFLINILYATIVGVITLLFVGFIIACYALCVINLSQLV